MRPSPRPHASLRPRLALAALLLAPLLAACGEEGDDLMFEMAIEWASEKNLITCTGGDPTDCEPSVNFLETGYYVALGLEPEVQSALESAQVARDIQAADALADQAWANDDPSKLAEAIALRPNDWSFREQLAAMRAGTGDVEGYYLDIAEADNLAIQHVTSTLEAEGLQNNDPQALSVCVNTYLNQFRYRESSLQGQLGIETDPPTMEWLIEELSLTRSRIANLEANNTESLCRYYGP